MTLDPSVYDVLIVGAGPGGISAACAAAEAGSRVAVVDAGREPGGQIWRGGRVKAPSPDAAYWLNRFEESGVEFIRETQIVALGGTDELLALHKQSLSRLRYRSLILATGAREAFVPFPGWTRPGVMGAGAIQAAVKSGLPIHGKRIIVAGTGPLLLAVAASLKQAGAIVPAVIEQVPYRSLLALVPKLTTSPSKLFQAASLKWRLLGTPFLTSSFVSSVTDADDHLAVNVRTPGADRQMDCDILACGYHLTPNLELPRLLGCEIRDGAVFTDSSLHTSRETIFAVGELLGIGGVECAILEGLSAGYAASGDDARANTLRSSRVKARQFGEAMNRIFTLRKEIKLLPTDDTVICRCEDVTHGQLKHSAGWREAKLYTRCGMGPCQGRICGCATQTLYGWTQETVRPPLYPVPATFWAELAPTPDS